MKIDDLKNREIISEFSGHGRFYGEIYRNFILELIPIESYIHEGSFNKVPLEYCIFVQYIPKGRKKPKILLREYSKSDSPKKAVKKGQQIIDNLIDQPKKAVQISGGFKQYLTK